MLGEVDRTRALYELAIAQPLLDMPETLWKSYIDFEIEQGERDRTRVLYERLLDRTKHVKVRRLLPLPLLLCYCSRLVVPPSKIQSANTSGSPAVCRTT